MTDLKPCPYCGNEKPSYKIGKHWPRVQVVCHKCGTRGPYGKGQCGAETAWNAMPRKESADGR